MSERIAYCMFCDDIRPELGNKNSVMGVYGSTLQVGTVPSLLSKLGFVVMFRTSRDEPVSSMTVKILVDDALFSEQVIPEDFFDNANKVELSSPTRKNINYSVLTMCSPFPINNFGRVTVFVKVDEQDYFAGELEIISNDEPVIQLQ